MVNTLHIQTKTNQQSQKRKEKNYTITQIKQQINNTDKQTNRWTISHGGACNLYSFVFVSLRVPVCDSVRACVRAMCIVKHY